MKRDTLIIGAAVIVALALVAKKTGLVDRAAAGPVTPVDLITGFLPGATLFENEDRGYNPADPGRYVSVDELIKGAPENDWQTIPLFSQTIDSVLRGGFPAPEPTPIWRLK